MQPEKTMRLSVVKEIAAKELLDAARDRRALYWTVVGPLLLFCGVLFLVFHERRMNLFSSHSDLLFCMTIPIIAGAYSGLFGIRITTGEKERGVIETTLCMPVSPLELAFGKYSAICLTALLGASLVPTLVALQWLLKLTFGVDPGEAAFDAHLSQSTLAVAVHMVGTALTVSALVLTIGSLTQSMTESNIALNILTLAVMLGPIYAIRGDMQLTVSTALIPLLNGVFLIREVFDNATGLAYSPIILSVSAATAWGAVTCARKTLTAELKTAV